MIALFLRSYIKDFQWLHHSVASMEKNLTGITDTILAVPARTPIPKNIANFFNKIVIDKTEHQDGYIDQQISKLKAHQYTNCEHILFSDSDCIYYKPFDANCRLKENKVILPYTPYAELDDNARMWQGITSRLLNKVPLNEYMRCFPILHHREVLAEVSPIIIPKAKNLTDRSISEFNCMGLWADLYHQDKYLFLPTNNNTFPNTKQYWSWGGITPEIAKEIQQLYN